MPTSLRLATVLATLPFASLAACTWNEVETGRNGLVQLTPDDCGRLGCDLDDWELPTLPGSTEAQSPTASESAPGEARPRSSMGNSSVTAPSTR